MITTPAEYAEHLWGITATDEEGNVINPFDNRPVLSVILPSDEKTFDVDLRTRTISVPTFLSVAKDHRAETVYFLVDRYFEYKDLAQTACMVEFINANGEGGYYPVPFYDITSYPTYIDENEISHEAKILIPWCIEGDVTKTAGTVQFALRFYQLDDSKQEFVYNVRTLVASGAVLVGMDESILDNVIDTDETLHANLLELINWKIEDSEQTIYWDDLHPVTLGTGRPSPITSEALAYQSMLEDSVK